MEAGNLNLLYVLDVFYVYLFVHFFVSSLFASLFSYYS